jgi:hypothetical protein
MRITMGASGGKGLITDLPDHALPINAWSVVSNARMVEGTAEKASGYADAYSTDPTVAPYSVFPYKGASAMYWVYAGLAKIKVMDGTTDTDITNAGADYTGTAGDKWTGGVLGGVLVLNNGIEVPQQWSGVPASPCVDLSNWTSTWKAKVLRPFGNFLVAGNISKSSTDYPYMIKWGHPAEAGTVPVSWDETDTTYLAGEQNLRMGGGFIVDMHTVGDINVVYKEGALVAMRFIRGNNVFSFETISEEMGIFSVNAVQNFTGSDNRSRSFVFGSDDVVVHDGRTVQSVIDDRVRRNLYRNIDGDNIENCFVAADQGRKEMWVCYPEQGSTWCNKALIWNWREDTWGEQDIPNLSHMNFGFFDPDLTAPTYSTMGAETYASTTRRYNDSFFNPSKRDLVSCSPSNVKLYEMNEGEQFDGVDVPFRLERTGWGFLLDTYGRPAPNKTHRKMVTELWPHFEGSGTVQISVGGQDQAEDPIEWTGPFSFTVGSDRKINCRTSWKLLSFKIEGDMSSFIRLVDLEVELKKAGSHW